MSLNLEEEHYIVFDPTNDAISEKSLKRIVYDNLCCAQLWDENFPIPWRRYPEHLPDCMYRPLAISVREAFCPDIEEELRFLKDLASRFGYDVYEKIYKFSSQPKKGEEEKKENNSPQ